MLTNAAHLKGLTIGARDGEIGAVRQFYFDDQTWAVRYLTVDTGSWLGGRTVLISPISIRAVDWDTRRLEVSLTKKQVEDSPDINTHLPVSRQHETEFLMYYGYPSYWDGPYLWGSALFPGGPVMPPMPPPDAAMKPVATDPADSHLRSSEEVTGYGIEALDGEIGHVDGFILDDEAWAIRYIEVATRNWWPGKKVLVSPRWIREVSWPDSRVAVSLSRAAIQTAPEYADSMPITREYEDNLHRHYDLPPYWTGDRQALADHVRREKV